MDWNEVLQWSQKAYIACIALVIQLVIGLAVTQEVQQPAPQPSATPPQADPKAGGTPLTAEQLAVYHSAINGKMQLYDYHLPVAIQTVPFYAKDCKKDLDWEPVDPAAVHRFRPEDREALGSKDLPLIDAPPGSPYSRSYLTLSEIRFETKHEWAIVSYSIRCGPWCGDGQTYLMTKIHGNWRRISMCDRWVSQSPRPAGVDSADGAVASAR